MSVGQRYLRLWERLGAVVGYVIIVAACIPITLPLAGWPHLVVVLIALHLAADGGRRMARGWGQRHALAVVATPDADPARLRHIGAASDPQGLVRALARMPPTARERWLAAVGDLPHRCGTTIRDEVARQGETSAPGDRADVGGVDLTDLAARLEWPVHRLRLRVLALAPNAIWLVLTVVAIAGWPTPGSGWFIGLVTLFCAVGLVGMTVHGLLDESRGHATAIAAAPADW